MSRSSVASKPSSAASRVRRVFQTFEARAVPLMRRLGELPFIMAVREALPWSFIGLAAAFVVILAAQLRAGNAAWHLHRHCTGIGAASGFWSDGNGAGRRSAASPCSSRGLRRRAALARKHRWLRARAAASVRAERDRISAGTRRLGTLRRDSCVRRSWRVDRVDAPPVAAARLASTSARCWGSAPLPHSRCCIFHCRRRLPRRCSRSRDWATRTLP